MPPAQTTVTGNDSTNNSDSQLNLATPVHGTSSSNSSINKDTIASGTRFQRFRETWAYDPFNQPDSIKRYDAWRENARAERKLKLQKMVHQTTYKAKRVVGLGSKRREGEGDLLNAQ